MVGGKGGEKEEVLGLVGGNEFRGEVEVLEGAGQDEDDGLGAAEKDAEAVLFHGGVEAAEDDLAGVAHLLHAVEGAEDGCSWTLGGAEEGCGVAGEELEVSGEGDFGGDFVEEFGCDGAGKIVEGDGLRRFGGDDHGNPLPLFGPKIFNRFGLSLDFCFYLSKLAEVRAPQWGFSDESFVKRRAMP